MKNPAYAKIKHLIDTGFITEFQQILPEIQKNVLYKDLHMGFQAFDRRLNDPALFTLGELMALADLIGVDPRVIVDLALKQKEGNKKSKPKK